MASPDRRAFRKLTKARCLRLALVLLTVAGFIIALVSRLPIVVRAVAFAAACLTPLLVERLRPTQIEAPRPSVELDTLGVRRVLNQEVIEQVGWEQLVKVSIVTTDEGPFVEDLFWLLHAADGRGCLVPQDGACEVGLLARLQQLPRFNNAVAIEASGSTSPREFVCWEGSPGEGLAARTAPQGTTT